MSWFRRSDGALVPDEEKPVRNAGDEFKPDEFKKAISDEMKAALKEQGDSFAAAMKPMQEMAELAKTERDNRAKAEREAAARKTREESEVQSEDFLLDPLGAVDRKLHSRDVAIINLASRQAVRETLEEKEYYHGDVKSRTDALIATLPLNSRADPASIENCYKIAFAESYQAIQEGKIKAKTAGTVFSSAGTGGHGGGDKTTKEPEISKDEQEVARKLGISEADWKNSKRELTYV